MAKIHVVIVSLAGAESCVLPQSLPQGVHLHVPESIIVVLQHQGGRDNAVRM